MLDRGGEGGVGVQGQRRLLCVDGTLELAGSSVGRPSISHTGAYVVFGIGGKLDSRFPASGIFANYTGVGPCHSCPE